MCDNMDDALLGDEGGIDGDYDIRAEDEEALLEEDNFDDQNLVSSSNRNYYGTREELEEEELDHEPEEPEDVMESDENVSDLPDEDANESFNKSANSREKRDTKFVSERNVPNSFDNSQMGSNKYMNPIGRPQQQHFNRNLNRGVRGGRFRGRGRGNLGNRPEAGKKVLINPHFAGNVQFNNQVRLPWHNNANVGNTAGRIQPWNQDRMPPPQRMPQNEPFQRQMHVPNKQFIQQQQQMDPDHMVNMPHQQYQKPPVHQRLGNQPHHNLHQNIDLPQPFIAPINPQANYPPPHVYQSPPSNNQQPPPPQILYQQPLAQYNQPPPMVNQQTFGVGPNQPQAGYSMSIPPPQMPVFTQQGGQQFSSPPPGYLAPSGGYEQNQAGVFVAPQQQPQHMGGFEFQPPPQVQMHPHEVQHFQQQQQIVYQQQMPPPNYHPQHEPSVQYNLNTHQYVQNTPQNNPQIQQERRVFAPRPTAQNRLGPPHKNQQQPGGRFIVNSMKRGGGNANRGGVYVNRGGLMVSPGKRRYSAMEGGTDQRRRRTAEAANLHEVPTVDSTTTVLSRIAPAVVKKHAEIEEDEETRVYRQKIENQKKIREKILAQKEERRKQAAMRTAAEKGLANLTPPSEIVAKLVPDKQSPIKTIISQNPHPILTKRRILKTNTSVNLNNRIVSQPSKLADQSPTTTNKDEISSFLTNRRIIAKDQSLANTSIVIVSNLAAGTSEVKLRKLCQGVGDVQVSVYNDQNASEAGMNGVLVGVSGGVNQVGLVEEEGGCWLENSIVCVEAEIETIKIEDDDF